MPGDSTKPKGWERTLSIFMGQHGALMLGTGL